MAYCEAVLSACQHVNKHSPAALCLPKARRIPGQDPEEAGARWGRLHRAGGSRPRLAGRPPTETAGWEASEEEEVPADFQGSRKETPLDGKDPDAGKD